MALIRRPTCATCSRESPLTRSIVSTSCCPGICVRAADDAHAPKRGALRRKPSLDQTSEFINLPINEQTSRARDPNSRRGSPDAYGHALAEIPVLFPSPQAAITAAELLIQGRGPQVGCLTWLWP